MGCTRVLVSQMNLGQSFVHEMAILERYSAGGLSCLKYKRHI